MSGDALELALALYRAPIQRFALRDRPLPDDIGIALQLASASPQLLQTTAARLCEPEARLLEAVRFYLQQVLFNPGTDAYRVLGLAPSAPSERIREHYRWLQRWLHPDRRGEDWEALFAVRVNWAWRQLRSEPARAAYDAEHTQSPLAPRRGVSVMPQMAIGEWKGVPTAPPRAGWPIRLALAASLGSCLGLLWLALTRTDPMALEEASERRELPSAAVGPRVRDRTVAMLDELAASLPPSALLPVAAEPAEKKQPESMAMAPVAVGAATVAPSSKGESETAIGSTPAGPNPGSRVGAALQPTTSPSNDGPETRTALHPSAPVPPAVTVPFRSAGVPRMADAPVAIDRDVATRQQLVAPTQALGNARVVAVPTIAAAARQDNDAADHEDAMPTARPGNAIAESAPALADDHGQADLSPPPFADVATLSERMAMASERLDDLSAYFGRLRTPLPPLWNDLDGQLSAERQHEALHDRARIGSGGRFEVITPDWRVSSEGAALRAQYRLRAGRHVFESGHLSLAMVWRAKMWLVTHVELSPDP